MHHLFAAGRRPRLAAVAAFVLLGMQVLAVPVRAAAAVTIDVTTGDTQVHVGDVIKFLFEVSNAGDTVLKVGPVSGSLCDSEPSYASGDTGSDGLMEPAETWLYDCPHEAVELAHIIQNVANVTAIPPGDLPDVTATDTVDVEVLHPGISVEASLGGQLLVGDKIRYSFSVFNPGDTPITEIVVYTDDCLTPLLRSGADDGNDGWIAPDAMEGWTYECDGPVVGATDTTFHTEVAVRGQDALIQYVEASASGDATVIHPALTFTSTTKQTTAHPGDTITFTYKLQNTGDTHVGTLMVTTTACDAGTLKYGDDGIIVGLQPGVTWLGSCTHKVTEKVGATVKNVFHFTGHGGTSFDLTVESSVKIVAKAVASASPTDVPVEPSASVAPSLEPSAAPSAPSAAPVTAPPIVATPAPTALPAPASSSGGLPILPILVVAVVIGLTVGGWLVWQRRRLASGSGSGGEL